MASLKARKEKARKQIQPFIDFFCELKEMLASGKRFRFWYFINRLDALGKKIPDARFGLIEKNVVIKGKLFLGKNSVIKSGSYLEGNNYIGADCTIGPNAYLRGTTLVACGSHIANSEVKNSIILSDSNVPHFSYVGDSILGENVNLGAGTKIANLRHDNSSVKVELRGVKTSSGRRKLGACIGNSVKIGINASINCGVILSNNSCVLPGEFVKKNR
ncbi:MAG: hypothetical protein V1494_06965 [Candidatus Diapherotrites archaeon]